MAAEEEKDAAAMALEERRRQAELRAAAAERRMLQSQASSSPGGGSQEAPPLERKLSQPRFWESIDPQTLTAALVLLFGNCFSKAVLSQWTSQGFLFGRGGCATSDDDDDDDDNERATSWVLYQLQGGPCGVLAPVQAFLMKHLLFRSDFCGQVEGVTTEDIQRSLKGALCETIWRAGNYERGCVVKLSGPDAARRVKEVVETLEDGCDAGAVVSRIQESFHIKTFSNRVAFLQEIGDSMLGDLRTDLGVLLALLAIVLARGVDTVQSDRDDTGQPLITPPFGHASQEIVNLFLSGRAVANVFDGDMEMGADYTLKGIPSKAQVGFLTLLESHNYLQVGKHLKEPEYPVWVLGSDSHYTILYSLDRRVQEESARDKREKGVREAFDAFDRSGGGGFIDRSSVQEFLARARCPPEVTKALEGRDLVTWHEAWAAVAAAEFPANEAEGAPSASPRTFSLSHVNGMAKLGADPVVKSVEVTMTPPMAMGTVALGIPVGVELSQEEAETQTVAMGLSQSQHGYQAKAQWCPLVDCIRTRWKEAECHWQGEAPSMV